MATKKPATRQPTLDDLIAGGYRYTTVEDAPQESEQAQPEKSSLARRALGDTGVALVKGAIGVPEALVGMADIATGGRVGKFLENEDGAVGFRPEQARQFLDQYLSPEQQAANQAVQQAEGFMGKLGAAVTNPSTIWQGAVESAPSMLGGGAVARGIMKVAPKVGAPLAVGAGEGAFSAGSTAEQIRQQTPDGLLTGEQAAIAAGSGAATGVLGVIGTKVAQKLGIGDVDALVAGFSTSTPKMQKGVVRSMLEGAVAEGVLEELPQSVQEQVAQNLALGKPLEDGVDYAAVMGMLSGGLMGGIAAPLATGTPAGKAIRDEKLPEVGPLTKALNAATELRAQQADAGRPTLTADQVTVQAQQRLAELDQKAKGTKDEKMPGPDGKPVTIPGKPAQFLTDDERQERDFLTQNATNPEALAQAQGATISPYQRQPDAAIPGALPPDTALARMEDMAKQQAQADRAAARASVAAETPAAAPAAAPAAPAADDAALPPEPTDILNPKSNAPWKSRTQAVAAQKKTPGTVLASVAGGYVLRPLKEPTDGGLGISAEPGLAGGSGIGPADAGGSLAGDGRPADEPGSAVPEGTAAAAAPAADAGVGAERNDPTVAADVAGEPIDAEWTAFKPETGTKAIPRADLPQIKAEHRGAMTQFLKARGIAHEQEQDVDPASLKPTQAEFAPGKVQRAREFTEGDRAILVSSDGHILDGHHQWLAAREDGKPIRVIRFDAPIEQLMAQAKEFPSSTTAEGAAEPATALAEQQRLFVDGPDGKKYPVRDVREAQELWTQFRDAAGEGVSKLGNGVRVVDQNGKFVARVSYNGRAWSTEDDGKGGGQVIAEAPASVEPKLDTPAPAPAAAEDTPQARWTRMPEADRLGVLGKAGWSVTPPSLSTQRMLRIGWDKMSENQRQRIAAAMESPATAQKTDATDTQAPQAPSVEAAPVAPGDAARGDAAGQGAVPGAPAAAPVQAAGVSAPAPEKKFKLTHPQKILDAQAAVQRNLKGELDESGVMREFKALGLTLAEVRSVVTPLAWWTEGTSEQYAKMPGEKTEPAQPTADKAPVSPSANTVKVGPKAENEPPAMHQDPGEPAEPATQAVVKDALQTAARNDGRSIKDVKAEALRLIDEAMANAKGEDDPDVLMLTERSRVKVDKKALDRRGLIGKQRELAEAEIQRKIDAERQKAADKIGYVTIDVPGDGEFKVLNTKERLAEFRRKVEKSPGFKAQRPGPIESERVNGYGSKQSPGAPFGVESGSGSKTDAFANMVDDGDMQAAMDYAEAVGIDPAKAKLPDVLRKRLDKWMADNKDRAPEPELEPETAPAPTPAPSPEQPKAERASPKTPATAQAAIDAFNADDSATAQAVMAKLPIAELQVVGDAIGFRPQINENAKRYRERVAEVADRLTKTAREQGARERALFDKLMNRAMEYDRAADHADRARANGVAEDSTAYISFYRPMNGGESQEMRIPSMLERLSADVRSLRNDPDYAKVAGMVREARPRVFDAADAPPAAESAAPAEPTAKPKAKPGEVENFGEALPPARRAMAAKLDESLTDDDIANRPLSEIWPLAENEAIEDTFAAAVAHAARAEVPAKPRVAYKLKQWVQKVKTVRGLAGKIVSGRVTREQMADIIRTTSRGLSDWWSKVQLLEQVPREQWKRIGEVEERPDAAVFRDGNKVPAPMVRIRIDDKSHWLEGDGTVAGALPRVRELLADAAPEQRMEFAVYQRRKEGTIFVTKKGDPEKRSLGEFATVEEARAAIAEYAGLAAAWEAVKARDNITERDLRSAENRPRVGKDHRGGKDVSAEQFQEQFGFRGGEFGAWVQQGKGDKERQALLNGAYDALMDLADIIGVPPRALSLNGTLGIAFGSRGSGWASAHFEPSNLVINLTKTRGAGALAHEWFHAADNYFARMRRDGAEAPFTGDKTAYRDQNYITHKPETLMVLKDGAAQPGGAGRRYMPPMTRGKLEAMHEARKHLTDAYNPERWTEAPEAGKVRPEVEARFADLVQALKDSPMAKRAALLDKGKQGYWSSTLEMAARAFENYVIAKMHEQGYHNDFLVNVNKAEDTGRDPARYPYLLAGEVKPIAEAFDALFDEVKTRENEAGNVALFSRSTEAVKRNAARLQTLIDVVSSQWENAPPIVVVESLQDPKVPQEVRDEDAKQRKGGAVGEPEGLYYKGRVYLIASQLAGARDALRVMFHETLGHHGLRHTFGRELGVILDRLAQLNPGKVRAKARQYGLDFDKQSERRQAAEEVLAEMAERTPELGFVQRAIAAIRSFLRRVVPGFQAMQFSDAEIIRDFILPARAWVEGGQETTFQRQPAPAFGREPSMSRTDTEAFKRWFGDSKVREPMVSSKQKFADMPPLVVYHATNEDITAFEAGRETVNSTTFGDVTVSRAGIFFAEDPKFAEAYLRRGAGQNVMPVYLSIKNPLYLDEGISGEDLTKILKHADPQKLNANDFRYVKPEQWWTAFDDEFGAEFVRAAKAAGFDGAYMIERNPDDREDGNDYGVWVAFSPEQIKSAIGNRGTFDPDDADIRFSRASDVLDTLRSAATAKGMANMAADLMQSDRSFNWWHRTIGTQFQKAKADADFGRVYEAAQDYLHDTSAFANDSAALAPDVVPQLKGWRDAFKSLRLDDADQSALASMVFQGTLVDERVYTDDELRLQFRATDRQIKLYRQFRAAVDRSLDTLVATDVARYIGRDIPPPLKAMISDGDLGRFRGLVTAFAKQKRQESEKALADVRKANRKTISAMWDAQKKRLEGTKPGSRLAIEQELENEQAAIRARVKASEEAAKAEAERWADFERKTKDKYERIDELQEKGYAPLMRFGQYTVYVTGPEGEQEFFGLYESQADANRAAREFRESDAYKDSKVVTGVLSQEAYKQFSGVAPETLEIFGELAGAERTPLFEQYLKLTKSNRSALKRLISRKGIAGYSEDTQRVLASFLTSNARASSGNLHLGDMTRLVAEIPKEKGDVKDEAIKLQEYVQNPTEEAQRVRGLLFVQYLGGSLASALVNMTQPFMMTFPYLSQFGGAGKAAARLGAAMKQAMTKQTGELGRALAKAEKEGIVSPQELHQLQAEASRTMGNHPGVRRLLFTWGAAFSLAEQFNRRVSFIAAWNTAKEQGIENAFEFASKAVDETQGVYNRGNRPNWARGAVGSTLFTFKQYSISYLEFLKRLPPQQRAIALMVLMLAAGAEGLPFAEDLTDLLDTIGQALGYDTNTKAWRNQVLTDAIGAEAADFALHGFSAMPGFPLDVSGRLALSNLLPGTGMLLKHKTDKSGEVFDVLGPAGGLVRDALKGEFRPLAIRNLDKGLTMYQTGEYRDTRDRRVVDVDGLDALVKGVGFQPAEVARESRKIQLSNQQVQLARVVESEIAAEWAQGIADKEPDKVRSAKQRLEDWNRDNPRSRIAINSGQLQRRVRELRMTRQERFQKTVPREMRSEV